MAACKIAGGVFALGVILFATAARAELTIVGAAGRTLEDAVVISASGEIFHREGGVWRRRGGGGVAPAVVGAGALGAAHDLWVMGAAAPPYRFDGTWNAWPLHDGADGVAGVLASPGAPVVALAAGRHVHALVMTEGKPRWADLGNVPGTVTALWITGAKEGFAAAAGKLYRLSGSWRAVPSPVAENVIGFAAGPAGAVLAIGDDGAVLVVGSGAHAIAVDDPKLAGFHARVAAGNLVAGDSNGGAVLASIDHGRLAFVEPIPVIAGDPLVALVTLADGTTIVATKSGAVLVRAKSGGFTVEHVDDTPPPAGAHAINPPAEIAHP